MIVSTRVEYGVMALLDIAIHSENGISVSTAEISERQNVSQKYLEQILPLLRQAGLIRAQKGLRGGYRLSRPAANVKLSEVINALDADILADMEPVEEGRAGALRCCINECLWMRLNGLLRDYAEKVTLAEFLAECKGKTSGAWDMYVI